MMTIGVMLDLLLVALLITTIVYAVILNRKLGALRAGREEMGKMIAEFTVATEKASVGMAELRKASDVSGSTLKEMLEEAQALREDLGFLIERGGVVADRLEGDVRSVRAVARDAGGGRRGDFREAQTRPTPSPDSNDDSVQKLRKILQATR